MRKYVGPVLAVGVVAASLALNAAAPHIYSNLVVSFAAKLWHLLLFGALWLAAYFAGRALLRRIGYRGELPPELSAGAGVVLFSLAAFGLAAAHVAYGAVVKVIVAAVLAAGLYPWVRRLAADAGRFRRWFAELEPGPAAWIFFGALLAFPLALAAAEPPLYWDALTYHLAVPHEYAAAHGFVYLPYNTYSSMPMGATMFYLWGMLWDGLTCANASYLAVSLLAVAVVYRLARFWLPQFYAAAAGALVFFTPVFFIVMPGAHVDHYAMLYAGAALFFYFAPGAGDDADLRRRRWAVGIFLGATLAIKYTSVYVLGAFLPVFVYDLARRRLRWRDAAVVLAVAFAFVVPWLVKAYAERGNPVFPLLYGVFGGRDFSPEQARRLIAWQHNIGAGRAWYDYLLLPYRISVGADFDYRDFAGVYLPFLIPLAALGVFLFRRAGRLAAFAWGFVACWSLGPQQLRFLDAGLGALAVGAAGALAAGEKTFGRRGRAAWRFGVVAVVIFAALAYNVGGLMDTLEGFDYLAGRDREQFLAERCGFYMAQRFINEKTAADAKILMVFTNHTLYLERDAVYDSFFEASAFLLAAEDGADAAGLYDLARRGGITHVHIFHMFEEKAWPNYESSTKNTFYEFVNTYGTRVYGDPLNDIYELVPVE
ncbi:MAG TPA: glycosyltransferase family 39 protein [bacterium]|nr:glycosyltransferase family 39 protein [bacterium]